MATSRDTTSSAPPLVGFETDKRKILSALLDTSEQRLSVVALIRSRGVGKTYLAKEIYTSAEVKEHFDVQIWVSAPYHIGYTNVTYNLSLERNIEGALKFDSLRDRTYCLVIDDLDGQYTSRNNDAWSVILRKLPDNNKGSRVLVTSRQDYGECGGIPILNQYEVGPRNYEESLEILRKAAFPEDPTEGRSAIEVKDVVMKCKGMPWPLRFLGGMLSERTWNESREVLDRIEAVKGTCFANFAMRFRDLPSLSKAVFLYFLTFTEDAEIHAKSLFRMLESESIVRSADYDEVELTSALAHLARRSMIEVTKRCSDGSVKSCRLHGPLLRLLAIHEAKEKRFVWVDDSGIVDLFDARQKFHSNMVKENHKYGGKSMDVSHLADAGCIFNFGENFPLGTALMSDRVLVIDDTHYENEVDIARAVMKRRGLKYLHLKISSIERSLFTVGQISLLFLETLDVGGTPVETLPESICGHCLKTLLLRNTKVSVIPRSLIHLENLDVRDTYVRSLPDDIWNFHLKSVLASDTFQLLDGPPSRAPLCNLKTLKTVQVLNKWAKKLPKFIYCNNLGLSNFHNAFAPYNALNWDVITKLLSTLEVLWSLKIQGSNVPPKIIDLRTSSSYKTSLQKLWVSGSYSRFSLSGIEMPPQLTTLTLENLEFDEDPMPSLGKLQRLRRLRLRWLLCNAQTKKMICSSGDFPQLVMLPLYHISGPEELSVEKRALPKVTHVVIDCCKTLKDLSDLLVDRMTPLKELHLHSMPPGLTRKFSDLPFVKIT